MVFRTNVRIDVTESVGLGVQLEVATWVYLPEKLAPPATVIFAFPGGTYSRAYYDMPVPDDATYSLARHLAEAGHIVVACDFIGIGDSTPYEPFDALTTDVVLNGMSATVNGSLDRLTSGDLVDGLGPVVDRYLIGIGHSMGSYLLCQHQANRRLFDAVALLGFSVVHRSSSYAAVADELDWASLDVPITDPTWPPRQLLHRRFHDESVPAEVIAVDDANAVRVFSWVFRPDSEYFGDPRVPEAARNIDVPVFLGFGTRDASKDPHSEPSAYPRSNDITIFVLPQSAHCFNLAVTRGAFYERLAGWASSVARSSSDVDRLQPH